MLRTRIIPVLLLRNESLVKTRQFGHFEYIGDPCNTVRIFNELEVDELVVLDIMATREKRQPNFELLADISSECFMPMGYGGGISSFEHARQIFNIGFEKVIINSAAYETPALITEIADVFGTQAVIASIDVKHTLFGGERVYSHGAKRRLAHEPVQWACEMEKRGAGEILLTSVNREGMWSGFDLDLVKRVCDAVSVPVVAQGGASGLNDIRAVVKKAGASAVALGSMVVFQKKDMGVLVNFPTTNQLQECLV
jgi:cyclase